MTTDWRIQHPKVKSNKGIMLLGLLVVACLGRFVAHPSWSPETLFDRWASHFHKDYATQAERLHRMAVFANNVKTINAFNAEGHSYKKGLNAFTDMTAAEVAALLPQHKPKSALDESVPLVRIPQITPPDSLDICNNGKYCTPSGDQGYCGSCYAYGSAHYLQTRFARVSEAQTGVIQKELPSVQQLVDCTVQWSGCGGGFADRTMLSNKHVSLNTSYPYIDYNVREDEAKNYHHECVKGVETPIRLDSLATFKRLSFEDIKRIIAFYDGFTTAIYANENLVRFEDGVYSDSTCEGKVTNHIVAVDGYGVEGDKKYLLVRNSWGNDWGVDGHFKIDFDHLCGINGDDEGHGDVNFVANLTVMDPGFKGEYNKYWFDENQAGSGAQATTVLAGWALMVLLVWFLVN